MTKNIKDENLTIGDNCHIANSIIMGFKESGKGTIFIGNNVRIDDGVVLRTCGGNIRIEDHTTVGRDVIIYAGGNVSIQKDCLISPRVQIYAQNHEIEKNKLIRLQGQSFYGIWIGEDCWIGAGSILTDKSYINHGCILGAGSILTKVMPHKNEVWAGNPANFIKKRK